VADMPDEEGPEQIEIDDALAVPVLVLSGEHDVATSRELQQALDTLLERGDTVVVDVTGITFVDSTTLGTLLTAHQRAARRGGELAIVLGEAATYTVRNAFRLVGLTRLARVFETRAEAVAAVAGG